MKKKMTKKVKPHKPCPECGTTKGDFGLASGMCMKCSDKSVAQTLKDLRAGRFSGWN